MDEREFQNYLDNCINELDVKQGILRERYGIGSFESYEYHPEDGTLSFKHSGQVSLVYQTIFIGSLVLEKKSWLWGWANPSIDPDQQKLSAKIKELRFHTGLPIFHEPALEANEGTAYELSALAVNILQARGIYRHFSGETQVFLAMLEISYKA